MLTIIGIGILIAVAAVIVVPVVIDLIRHQEYR